MNYDGIPQLFADRSPFCSCCLEDTSEVSPCPCAHPVCSPCLERWRASLSTCMHCRAPLFEEDRAPNLLMRMLHSMEDSAFRVDNAVIRAVLEGINGTISIDDVILPEGMTFARGGAGHMREGIPAFDGSRFPIYTSRMRMIDPVSRPIPRGIRLTLMEPDDHVYRMPGMEPLNAYTEGDTFSLPSPLFN